MKILVISDTHGSLDNFRKVLKLESPVDMIIHCGDVSRDEEEIRELAGERCTVCFVRGNCDWFSTEPEFRDFPLGKHHIHLEHGHHLPDSLQSISYFASSVGADIVFFGHTHRPLLAEMGGVHIANPGSLSSPRQADGLPTYIIMETDQNGEITLTPKTLNL